MEIMNLQLTRLSKITIADIIALHTDAQVIRHMPLAGGAFGEAECAAWVADKERLWETHGYGPWAFLVDGRFAGWGGLQPEEGEADLALVLFPRYWGHGRTICREIIKRAFGEMSLASITALLPVSRVRTGGMRRLGFEVEGEVSLAGETFVRYRLRAQTWPG